MARPRKDPKDIRRNMTGAWLTDKQFAIVTRAAALAGVPKAVYIRSRIVSAAVADIRRLQCSQADDTRRASSSSQ